MKVQLTAIVLKYDPHEQKVQKNAGFNRTAENMHNAYIIILISMDRPADIKRRYMKIVYTYRERYARRIYNRKMGNIACPRCSFLVSIEPSA